ncbi:HNH endonuclease [Variovorax sp. LT1R20]|uniref:HNH endonuclease n=1 Tax=Variovorax sp. LT1R20 TaxID=3443729 RepID=UPI003F447823
MAIRTSSQLGAGSVYTRDKLREIFRITDANLNNGIFHPKGTQSVWLFVTEEKTPDRVQYKDHLDGDVLLMQGQTEGRTDHLLEDQATNGLELLVFHRTKKYEHESAGFRYAGPFHYIRSYGSRPTSFVLMREKKRQFQYGKQTWRWTLEAVRHHGGRATPEQIGRYIAERVPDYKTTNVGPDLRLLSVNEYGRSAWTQNRFARRTDGWSPVDALFRRDERGQVFYELYDPDPVVHGVWELAADDEGVMRPYRVSERPEMLQVQKELQAAKAFDAGNDEDGRKRVVMSIAQRQGQPKFRGDLLAAYDKRCAVTGCSIREILEGAHIKPYRGDHTNHVTNGLLLRADIHTLFDLGLLRVSPVNWVVEIAEQARSTYGGYHKQALRLPEQLSLRPDAEAMRQHYERWAGLFV